MINSTHVPICNRFHSRRANSSKITFLGDVPHSRPHSKETPLPVAVLAHKIWGHGPMASAVARAYNRVRGLKAFLAFGRSMEAANLTTFRNFGNTKTSDIYVIFAKKSWAATKLGGGAKLGGACAPARA